MNIYYSNKLPQPVYCPKCRAQVDGFTAVNGGSGPTDKSLSVCVYCHSINVFNVAPDGIFSLRIITDDELAELKKDVKGWRMVQIAISLSRSFMEERQKLEN